MKAPGLAGEVRQAYADLGVAAQALLWTGVALWLYLLMWALADPGRGTRMAAHAWVSVVAMGLAWQGWLLTARAARVVQVLEGLCAPGRLSRAYVRGALGLGMAWLLGAVPAGGVLLVLVEPQWHWAFAPALFSLLTGLGCVGALVSHGVLRRAWGWAAGLVAVLLGLALLTDLAQTPPASLHLLLALLGLGGPVLCGVFAVLLGRRLLRGLVGPWAYAQPQRLGGWLHQRVHATMGRYTQVSVLVQSGALGRAWGFYSYGFNTYMACYWLSTPWGSEAGPAHLLKLAMLVLMLGGDVLCKDLHWRHLLAPRTLHSGGVGWHVLRSTLAVQWALYALLALVWVAVSWPFLDDPWQYNLTLALRYRLLPLELLAATSLAVLLVGLGRTGRRWVDQGVLAVYVPALVLAWGAMVWTLGPGALTGHDPAWFTLGPAYVQALLGVTAAAVLALTQVWRTQSLLPTLRKAVRA